MQRRALLSNNKRLKAFEDTYVDGGSQSTNYSSSVQMLCKTGGTSVTRYSYLQFKASDLDKYKKLILTQFGHTTWHTATHFLALDVMQNVDLTTLTWLNTPALFSYAISTVEFGQSEQVYEFDIETFMQTVISDTITFRVRITTTQDTTLFFRSKEYDGGRFSAYLKK